MTDFCSYGLHLPLAWPGKMLGCEPLKDLQLWWVLSCSPSTCCYGYSSGFPCHQDQTILHLLQLIDFFQLIFNFFHQIACNISTLTTVLLIVFFLFRLFNEPVSFYQLTDFMDYFTWLFILSSQAVLFPTPNTKHTLLLEVLSLHVYSHTICTGKPTWN